MRGLASVGWLACVGWLVLPPASVVAQKVSTEVRPSAPISATRHARPLRRVPIYSRGEPDDVYPRYYPGPNAVRECSASYVPEYRPSGTVIIPRVNCFWRGG